MAKHKKPEILGVCKTTGKRMFVNGYIASKAVGRMYVQGKYGQPGDLHSYRCEDCGHFHIGHPIQHNKSLGIPYNEAIVQAYNVALECIEQWLAV